MDLSYSIGCSKADNSLPRIHIEIVLEASLQDLRGFQGRLHVGLYDLYIHLNRLSE